MNTHPDFEDLLRLLEGQRVEYMIVGGYAVAYHGHPRFTKDIDVFFQRSEENVTRLRHALLAFGFGEGDLPLAAITPPSPKPSAIRYCPSFFRLAPVFQHRLCPWRDVLPPCGHPNSVLQLGSKLRRVDA
jgi:hypothetical protein